MRDGGVDNFARDGCPTHQLGHDVDFRMGNDLAPIGRLPDRDGCRRQILAGNRTAAKRLDAQRKAQLACDLGGVFGQDGERTTAHIPQADDADIDLLHMQSP